MDASPLENDPANPCFGCGPQNPMGLHLQFERQGDEVRTLMTASTVHQGWPGRLHSGILYLAMLETANWTVYGLTERIGIPLRTTALDGRRWVGVGEALTLVGRRAGEGDEVTIEVEARDGKGALVAGLSRTYTLPTRSEFLRRMGYEELPPGFEGAVPDR